MTIDKAIRILTAYSDNMETDLIEPEHLAIRIGNEAMKEWFRGRSIWGIGYFPLLPGETEEVK